MEQTQSFLESLKYLKVGIEKEGLRVQSDLSLSKSAHPYELGSKLTHPYITTDYAEALLEYVTPAFVESDKLESFLQELHLFTYLKDPNEIIWPSSMPCVLPENDKEIEIAQYGSSNLGKLKTLYREGLGHRYGRKMQSIAGLHFNFSVSPELLSYLAQKENLGELNKNVQNILYFNLIKNFRRHSWILMYLFGASPIVDKSFLVGRKHDLEEIAKDSFGLPYATSLRMGGLGYTSNAQKEITVCFNKLENYINNIEKARRTPYKDYENIGVKVDGKYRQLNSNLIQIDNEYYSTIRPKAIAKPGMSALQALDFYGIEYVEVRIMDLDPFSLVGISRETSNFLKSFLLFCLFNSTTSISDTECEEIDRNHLKVVREGRRPGLTLEINNKEISLKDQALKILDDVSIFSNYLDKALENVEFTDSLKAQIAKIQNSDLTPSAKLLTMVSSEKSYVEAINELANKHKSKLNKIKLDSERILYFDELAKNSWNKQKEIEEKDDVEFEEYLEKYFEQIKLENKNA